MSTSGKKILIIDDDPDYTDATRLVLENKGYSVSTASNCNEAASEMSKSVPNLIILDVMMVGETDGIHFAKTLKDNPKTVSIPVLMMTSIGRKRNFRFEGEKDKDYLPVDDFLDKPAAPDVLLKHVETLLLR